MKNLINSIKLISINYMFLTNNTMHKFGIEYSYIATAMGTMLKSTDNNVKRMEINEREGIAIDDNWWYAVQIVFYALAWIGFGLALLATWGVIAFAGIALIGVTLSVAHSCFNNFDL